jgi:hypothetical protein
MRHLGPKDGELRAERLGHFVAECFEGSEPVDEVVTTLDEHIRRSSENSNTPAVRSPGHPSRPSTRPRPHGIEAPKAACAILRDEFLPELVDGFVVRRPIELRGWFRRPREHLRRPLPIGILSSLATR